MSTKALHFDGSVQGQTVDTFPALTTVTWCGFVAPDEDPTTATFKAIVNIGCGGINPAAIVYMHSVGSVGTFRMSINDEAPDVDTDLQWIRNTWYFIAVIYQVTASDGASADFGIFAKPVRAHGAILTANDSDVGAINWIRSKTQGAGTFGALVANGSGHVLSFGESTFGEHGSSAQCGHKFWNHRLTLAEIHRESRSIRAIKRAGLVGEYPMQDPADTREYSGKSGGYILTDGTAPIVTAGPPLPPQRRSSAFRRGTLRPSVFYDVDLELLSGPFLT